MDIVNATAGGPSYGLLDMIFGSKAKEEADGAEAGFESLMNMLKGMKSLDGETKKSEFGWTDKGTDKGQVDYRAVGITDVLASLAKLQNQSADLPMAMGKQFAMPLGQRMMAGVEQQTGPALKQALLLPQLQKEDVNQLLSSMGAASLSADEMELLEKVNAEIKEKDAALASSMNQGMPLLQNVQQGAQQMVDRENMPMQEQLSKRESSVSAAGMKKATPDSQKQMTVDSPAMPPESKLAELLNRADVKSAELIANHPSPQGKDGSSAGAKMLSTEAYLSMHDGLQGSSAAMPGLTEEKAKLKAEVSKGKVIEVDAEAAAQGTKIVGAQDLKSKVLSGDAAATVSNEARNAQGEAVPQKGTVTGKKGVVRETNADKLLNSGLGSDAVNAKQVELKDQTSAAGVVTKDILVPAGNSQQMRAKVIEEVSNYASAQAFRGGGEMKLILHPNDLGEIHMKVGTNKDKVEIKLDAGNEEVASMLRSGSKSLEDALKDQGFTLAKFEVSVSEQRVAFTESKFGANDQQHNSAFQQFQSFYSMSGDGSDSGRNSFFHRDPGSSAYGMDSDGPAKLSSAKRAMTPARSSGNKSSILDVVA